MIETTSSKLNKIKILFRLLIVWNKQILLKTEDNDFYEKQKNHVCEMITVSASENLLIYRNCEGTEQLRYIADKEKEYRNWLGFSVLFFRLLITDHRISFYIYFKEIIP